MSISQTKFLEINLMINGHLAQSLRTRLAIRAAVKRRRHSQFIIYIPRRNIQKQKILIFFAKPLDNLREICYNDAHQNKIG